MPDWMDEAKNLAAEHSDVADKGFDEGAQFAESKTGGKFDSEIQGAEQHGEGFLGVKDQDSNNQDSNNQGSNDQGRQGN
ncbi:MAG: antitoxin [Actinomycetota bacterium]|nr:antitoxin [Actinomycetota bacterium]